MRAGKLVKIVRLDSSFDPLGVGIIAAGLIGLELGFAIIRRIARGPDDNSDHFRYRR